MRSGLRSAPQIGAFFVLLLLLVGCQAYSANPGNLDQVVAAAQPGDVILLEAGDYGTWQGTNKAIFLTPAQGARVTMKVNATDGDCCFTLNGISEAGGSISRSAHDITIQNSDFTSAIRVEGTWPNSDILLDHNTHNNIPATVAPHARVTGLGPFTIRNSTLVGGNADGVRIDSSGGINVIGNEFRDILYDGDYHTDMIQFYGGSNAVIRGNTFTQTAEQDARRGQFIAAYDGTANNLIENNVVDSRSRPWGIELYSDDGSIIRGNIVVYRPDCDGSFCGQIDISHKDPPCPRDCDPSRNTQVYNNVAVVKVRPDSVNIQVHDNTGP